jgi:hypothetical protein
MQALSSGEGLQRFLSHRERFAVPHGGRTASERLFRLAGMLAGARFWQIVPGGTPEETREVLIRAFAAALSR